MLLFSSNRSGFKSKLSRYSSGSPIRARYCSIWGYERKSASRHWICEVLSPTLGSKGKFSVRTSQGAARNWPLMYDSPSCEMMLTMCDTCSLQQSGSVAATYLSFSMNNACRKKTAGAGASHVQIKVFWQSQICCIVYHPSASIPGIVKLRRSLPLRYHTIADADDSKPSVSG